MSTVNCQLSIVNCQFDNPQFIKKDRRQAVLQSVEKVQLKLGFFYYP